MLRDLNPEEMIEVEMQLELEADELLYTYSGMIEELDGQLGDMSDDDALYIEKLYELLVGLN